MKKISGLIAFLAMVFLCGGPVSAGINDGLVAYYPFNGNANDESGNGNDGTVNGAIPTIDRFGSVDAGYEFNGNSDFTSKLFGT